MDTSSPLSRVCSVCETTGVATGRHYGGVTCYSCRAFFRRVPDRKRPPRCKYQAKCPVTQEETEKQCGGCRFQKCIRQGFFLSNWHSTLTCNFCVSVLCLFVFLVFFSTLLFAELITSDSTFHTVLTKLGSCSWAKKCHTQVYELCPKTEVYLKNQGKLKNEDDPKDNDECRQPKNEGQGGQPQI